MYIVSGTMKFLSTVVLFFILFATIVDCRTIDANPRCNYNFVPYKYVAVLGQRSETYGDNYVPAAVVQYLESFGATVVIIPPRLPTTTLRYIIYNVQGIVLPGGQMLSAYRDDVSRILNIVSQMPPHNKPPVLGISGGMEAMAMAWLNSLKSKASYSCDQSQNVNKMLSMNRTANPSKIGQWLFYQRSYELAAMSSVPMLASFHKYCLNTRDRRFDREFIVVANEVYGHDSQPSIIEHKREPFYGVQFHPEKNGFEWKMGQRTNHSPEAQIAMRTFGDFFMSQVNRATNYLPSYMNKYLASQHCRRHVDQLSRSFTSVYVPCTVQLPRQKDLFM